MVNLQEADQEQDPAKSIALMANAARAISELSRANIAQKKHAIEIARKAKEDRDKEIAEAVEAECGGSITPDRLREIMRETYGV
jgi:hypothetical protein